MPIGVVSPFSEMTARPYRRHERGVETAATPKRIRGKPGRLPYNGGKRQRFFDFAAPSRAQGFGRTPR